MENDPLMMIERLLGRRDILDDSRDELLSFKHQLAKGELDPVDLDYLKKVYARIF